MNILRRLDLLQFLKHATKSANSRYSPSSSSSFSVSQLQQVYVLGNPSADLDSIISAIIYSYFATRDHQPDGNKKNTVVRRQYIPLINLAEVSSGKELRRLRPEFVAALKLAVSDSDTPTFDGYEENERQILKESILTVKDLKEWLQDAGEGGRSKQEQLDVMMVDWNALPKFPSGRGIEGLSDAYPNLSISVTGCIDHHDDEAFVPESSALPPYDPRCIQTGVGSCTSLVVRELRSRGLWPEAKGGKSCVNHDAMKQASASPSEEYELSPVYEAQAAKLALAAILIDTADMTAESKVSDTDREAVAFLEAKIRDGTTAGPILGKSDIKKQEAGFDRKYFYNEISRAKENSVDNLTIDEILGRDYKDWNDTATKGPKDTVKLGICNVVKPLSWLLQKVSFQHDGSYSDQRAVEYLYDHLQSFGAERALDVIALMTVYNSPEGFQRELLVYVLNSQYEEAAQGFENRATGEFGLESWKGEYVADVFGGEHAGGQVGYRRVWRQTDVSKSRKQVAPLLRKALAGTL